MRSSPIDFSIITPVYNASRVLPRTLEKIDRLDQASFEIFFIDDGSVDDSSAILAGYCEKHQNAHYLMTEHKGTSAARNLGLDRARGDRILFLDADDELVPDVFSVLKEKIDEDDADIMVFGAKVVNYDSDHVLSDITTRDVIYRDSSFVALFEEPGARPYVWNCAYKNDFIKNNGLRFDESVGLGEDQLFQFNAFPKARVIRFISEKLYIYNYLLNDDTVIKEYLSDLALRCEKHVFLIDKILNGLSGYADEYIVDMFIAWEFDFIMADMSKLARRKRNCVMRSIRAVHAEHKAFFGLSKRIKNKIKSLSLTHIGFYGLIRIYRRMRGAK